jgi:hypothetical protein
MLNGEIEDYYPDVAVSNKTEAALEFSVEDYSTEELREHFTELPGREEADVEAFLDRVFAE